MIMPNTSLSLGAYGAAVASLHEFLGQQGIKVPAAEVDRGFFGPHTREAVQQYQRNNGLPPSGKLDANTARLISSVVPNPLAALPTTSRVVLPLGAASSGTPIGVLPETPVVEGPVSDANGEPLIGGIVVLNHVTIAGSKPLGKAVTDAQGFYRITYHTPPPVLTREALVALGQAVPIAIQVQLIDSKRNCLFTSTVIYSPPTIATIPIHLGGTTRTHPAEFSAVAKMVTGVLEEVRLTDLVENDKLQQVSFVA